MRRCTPAEEDEMGKSIDLITAMKYEAAALDRTAALREENEHLRAKVARLEALVRGVVEANRGGIGTGFAIMPIDWLTRARAALGEATIASLGGMSA